MKNKNSFATGCHPDAVQRADSAGRLRGEATVSRQTLKNTSAQPEAMLKNHAVDFSTLSRRPERFSAMEPFPNTWNILYFEDEHDRNAEANGALRRERPTHKRHVGSRFIKKIQ